MWIFDIKANGLLWPTKEKGIVKPAASQIWCFCAKELGRENWFTTCELEEAINWLYKVPNSLAGHNIIGYDLPLLQKLGKLRS